MRVLLVSTDTTSLSPVAKILQSERECKIDTARDGCDALHQFAATSPNIVVIAQEPPLVGLNAAQLCLSIRALSETVGLVLTTHCNSVEWKLQAFSQGVDDFIVQPTDPREVVARLKALTRRATRESSLDAPHLSPPTNDHLLTHGSVVVDLITQSVTVAGAPIDVSRRQFLLLTHLLQNPGRPISEQELREQVLRMPKCVTKSSIVRNHVYALRLKLGPAAVLIQSANTGGYGVALPVSLTQAPRNKKHSTNPEPPALVRPCNMDGTSPRGPF